MYHYNLKFFNLANPAFSPIEISFQGSRLKAKLLVVIITWKLFRAYLPCKLGFIENSALYTAVFFDKKTNKLLIGVKMEEECIPPNNFNFST